MLPPRTGTTRRILYGFPTPAETSAARVYARSLQASPRSRTPYRHHPRAVCRSHNRCFSWFRSVGYQSQRQSAAIHAIHVLVQVRIRLIRGRQDDFYCACIKYVLLFQPVQTRFDRSIAPELVIVLVCKLDHVFHVAKSHVFQRYGRHPISRFLFYSPRIAYVIRSHRHFSILASGSKARDPRPLGIGLAYSKTRILESRLPEIRRHLLLCVSTNLLSAVEALQMQRGM